MRNPEFPAFGGYTRKPETIGATVPGYLSHGPKNIRVDGLSISIKNASDSAHK